ncbi:hypothetical protein Pmani_028193 [Petrolisthes manimaculis]|uniref:Uncharacterized protein n=1 Tax=Petrolisthes manimaculis TaxID=1843537 RepID=A0AAE1P2L9_9EUCA|nr:hypothetical protein Pmani_028193 [Petrolisthes manimaculis]
MSSDYDPHTTQQLTPTTTTNKVSDVAKCVPPSEPLPQARGTGGYKAWDQISKRPFPMMHNRGRHIAHSGGRMEEEKQAKWANTSSRTRPPSIDTTPPTPPPGPFYRHDITTMTLLQARQHHHQH